MGIEPDDIDSVKAADAERLRLFFAQTAFPTLAVAADAQHAAFVCLNARFAVLDGYTLSFRGLGSRQDSIDRALQDLRGIIRTRVPATLVVEASPDSQLDRAAAEIIERARALADEETIRVHCMSLRSASNRIVVNAKPTFRNATRVLLGRYDKLRTCLAPDGKLRLRDNAVWRKHRALAAAFCFAHAFALETVVAACRPFANRPPPPFSPI